MCENDFFDDGFNCILSIYQIPYQTNLVFPLPKIGDEDES